MFSFRNFLLLSEFLYFLYDCHIYFGPNAHKGHFNSFNALSFSNMNMMLEGFPRTRTIFSTQLAPPPFLRQTIVGISYPHHNSAFGRFFSSMLGDCLRL